MNREFPMKLWDSIKRIAAVPYQWASHLRVNPSTFSFIGACVALFFLICGMYLAVIAAHEAGGSFLLGLAGLLILPAIVVARMVRLRD